MIKNKILKILIAIIYFVILFSFLWYLFKNFNLKDFSSFDIVKSNRDLLEEIKNKNIILSALIFFYNYSMLDNFTRFWYSHFFNWRIYFREMAWNNTSCFRINNWCI